MNRRTFVKTLPALTVMASTTAGFAQDTPKAAQDLKPITLPKPDMDGGKSVLAALKERQTTRNISAKELPAQILSNLLWAAFGVNREKGSFDKPGRTAASASNSQEIDLYVALPEGVYLYNAVPHRLTPVVAGDLRGRAGRGAAASAPVNIFFVVDLARYDTGPVVS
jgi:Nitroreductase family